MHIIRSIKWFLIKFFVFFAIIIGGFFWFLYSTYGENFDLVKSLKNQTKSSAEQNYNQIKNDLITSIKSDLGIKDSVSVVVNNKIINNIPEKVSTNNPFENNENINKKEIKSEFSLFEIPFYYDHSNAPKSVSKDDALSLIQIAQSQWTKGCNVAFIYKGDRLADYVNNKNTVNGNIGIIKWETQMEGAAIGEAHVGNSHGPAKGFVLALYSDYFSRNKDSLVNTITHEMGHVIGLPHSVNKKSIMFPSSHPNAILEPSDIAMCKYMRSRWNGLNKQQAENKSGVLFNGGADAEIETSYD